ncbi:LIC_10190 family membrane protein [Flavobacterium cerinum]|uniref:DUF8201 domain-containing protein n=1 Tax=Flavobacterium cerinum TaxID=2502784 RepID=A0ABY5ITV4_9FLAO|nr:hypothetical protein [Flavobacterium cerinum]UUC46276.1 hypothetical protein NOX80_03510 [Flavobacterium cerinum]
MYILLVCFLIISFIFIISGESFILYFDKNAKDNYSVVDSFFIGLCLIGALLNIWSLFLPTDVFSLLFVSLLSLALFFIHSKHFISKLKAGVSLLKSEKIFFVVTIIAIVSVLLFAVINPQNYDTYLYHINAIQWNEMYRAVPGLANLHDRFGFNSSMMVMSAAFSFNAIYDQYIFALSAIVFLVFFIWLLQLIYYKKGVTGMIAILFLYFFTQLYAKNISSPGTDLIPNIFVAYILFSLLFDTDSLNKKYLLFVVVPFFGITFKLSIFPLVFLGLIALYQKHQNKRFAFTQLFTVGSFLILPWLVRNVILTGYLIYPMDTLDFFNFDWKVPKENVIATKNAIYNWAKVPMRNPHEVAKLSFNEWFSIWWKMAIFKTRCFLLLAVLAPVFYGLYLLISKKERKKAVLFFVIVAYLGLAFWFFSAPDVRFSLAFILVLALFPLFILQPLIDKIKNVLYPIVIAFTLFFFYTFLQEGYALFQHDYRKETDLSYLYLPEDIYFIKEKRFIKYKDFTVKSTDNQDFKIYAPSIEHAQCYDKFPCTPTFDYNINMKGDDFQDGFKYGK